MGIFKLVGSPTLTDCTHEYIFITISVLQTAPILCRSGPALNYADIFLVAFSFRRSNSIPIVIYCSVTYSGRLF